MPENINIEYKSSWDDKYLKQLCSFANAQGGTMLIGVDDKGNIIGLENYKKLMEDLPNKIQSKLGIFAEVELLESDGKHYIKINVSPSTMAISLNGQYYQRTGSTTKELTGNALSEFLLNKTGLSWGDVIEERASMADIDENSVQTYKDDAERSERIPEVQKLSTEQLFEKLQLTENGTLKRAAIVLFGKNPEKFYHQTYVKIGRFVGGDISPRFHEIIEGNIITLQKRVFEIIDTKFIIKNISYDKVHRIETPEFPFPALREAILNALIHRDYMGSMTQIRIYDNKLQIWNDGQLIEGLTIDQLKTVHPSKPRNKLIAAVCLKGGYIEAWGTGITRIIDACRNDQLVDPILEEAFGGFQVTILKDHLSESYLNSIGLNQRQIKTIFFLKDEESINNSGYCSLNDVSSRTALRDLEDLIKKELVVKTGSQKNTLYTLIKK